MTTLRDVLATPYVTTARPVQDASGMWLRRAECPELPHCYAVAESPWDAFELLEAALPAYLLQAVLAGQPVPTPRGPLPGVDVERLLADSGLARFSEYLDVDVRDLAGVVDAAEVERLHRQSEAAAHP